MKKALVSVILSMILLLSVSCTAAEHHRSGMSADDPSVSGSGTTQTGGAETVFTKSDADDNASDEKKKRDPIPDTTPIDGVTAVICDHSTAEISGEGASVNGKIISITRSGEYEIKGYWEGQFRISVGDGDKVKLILKGLTAENTDDSVIYVENADKVTIRNQNGYVNTIKDSDTSEEGENDTRGKAAIYARSSLDLSGSGTMFVTSEYKHSVSCTKKLTVESGNITLDAADCGLKGNNSVVIEGGDITINSKGDAIKNEDDDDEDHGYISIVSGKITINTEKDGIVSVRSMTITGGSIDITTTGDDTSDPSGGFGPGGGGFGPGGGGFRPGGGGFRPSDGGYRPGNNEDNGLSGGDTVSSKGIKVGSESVGTKAEMTISGGTIRVDSTGHSIHSTGNISISGDCLLTLASGQKGIQAHGTLTVESGSIEVTKSTEGLESKGNMYLRGGKVSVYATDDGLNTGNRGSTIFVSGGEHCITTSSGDTDGIDSNGSLSVSGGFLLVRGGSPQGNMAGSIDVDGTVSVTGGTVVAVGGICETPTGSGQCPTCKVSRQSLSAGDYSVLDANGNKLITFSLDGTYSGLWISSDSFESGSSYTLCIGTKTVTALNARQ